MKMHLQATGAQNLIRGYDPHEIFINEQPFSTSVALSPERVLGDGYPDRPEHLTEAHVTSLLALDPEVILIGTGRRQQFPAPAVLRGLIEAGIGFEIMDTGAACRTYNILVGEGRRVAALLLISPDSV